ncbi:MAG: hypothetical protein R3F14_16145 [Polyangiaceae bacterium]
MSEALRRVLSKELHYKVRNGFDRSCEAMLRELRYLQERNDRRLGTAIGAGWTLERVKVLIVLNCFHRLVLGPLEAAYLTGSRSGLGTKVPIKYGNSFTVGRDEGAGVRNALYAFEGIVKGKGIRTYWLNVPRLSDLLFALGQNDGGEQ